MFVCILIKIKYITFIKHNIQVVLYTRLATTTNQFPRYERNRPRGPFTPPMLKRVKSIFVVIQLNIC